MADPGLPQLWAGVQPCVRKPWRQRLGAVAQWGMQRPTAGALITDLYPIDQDVLARWSPKMPAFAAESGSNQLLKRSH